MLKKVLLSLILVAPSVLLANEPLAEGNPRVVTMSVEQFKEIEMRLHLAEDALRRQGIYAAKNQLENAIWSLDKIRTQNGISRSDIE